MAELKENRRQQHDWHRAAVAIISHAIEYEETAAFAQVVQILEQHEAIAFSATKDDPIAPAITWY